MKNGKRPTKAQKIFLKDHHFRPENWLVVKNTTAEMVVVHRYTNTMHTISKRRKEDAE